MTEALAAMLRFGFERLELHSVEANVDPRNQGSIAVLLRLVFRQKGLFRESYIGPDGEITDTASFSLLRAWLDRARPGLSARG